MYEGRANMQINAPNGSRAIVAMNRQEAYVLCAGTVESKNMQASFNTSSGFRILNTLAFADCISRYIPGFVQGVQGLCTYKDDVLIRKRDAQPIKPPDAYPNLEGWEADNNRYVAEQMVEALFIKQAKYAHQGEYRFIWFAMGEERRFIDVKCSEAARFCEPLI